MNGTLCDFCKPLFEGEVLGDEQVKGHDQELPLNWRQHHDNARDLVDCGQTQCLLCAALWASVQSHRDKYRWLEADRMQQSNQNISVAVHLGSMLTDPEKDRPVFTLIITLTTRKILSEGTLTFYEETDSQHLDHHLLPSPGGELESTASTRSMEWVRDMIRECTSIHKRCNDTPTSWLPTRLIHLGGRSQPPRVVETAGISPGPDRPPTIKYTTLSHCWGTVDTFKLTSKNRSDLYEEIQPNTIPKTYAEAMETTKSLGLEYIWIDSLCIIQDDPDDWQYECAQMAEVYRRGYCNIAALEATDSHGGCFRQRDPVHLAPVLAETKWKGQDHRLWVRGPFPDRHAIANEIDNSPLHRRAWVLQERHMTPRNLHFGRKAIFWECRTVTGCESGDPFKVGSLFATRPRDDEQLPTGGVHYTLWIWSQILERYTNAALTFQSDKFIAISALARETQLILSSGTSSKVEYLAGLWKVVIEHQLMWVSESPKTTTRISESDQLTAPSWSWASLNGPVYLFALPWIYESYKVVARVLRHTIVPRSGDPFFGPATRSKSVLEINGLLWRLADSMRKKKPRYSSERPVVNLHWDTKDRSSRIGTACFLLPVLIDQSGDPRLANILTGLILHKVDQSTKSFQRVGVFEFRLWRDNQDVTFKSWRERSDRYLELCLEQNIVWPSQYDNRPSQSTPFHKVWAKATAHRTIFLE